MFRGAVSTERPTPRVATALWLALVAFALTVAMAVAAAPAGAAQTIDLEVQQATGTAPFDPSAGPGNDVSADNGIVRSNDTVTYNVEINVNDSQAGSSTAGNVTVTQTLPAGLEWAGLPATCRTTGVTPSSSISPDGRTIVCNIGDQPTGRALTVPLRAKVTEMTNGTVLTAPADAVSVTADGVAPVTDTPDPVTVSSIPRINMVKQDPSVTRTTRGGVAGYDLEYVTRIQIPSFGGRGLIGYAPPDPAMTLVDDYGAVSPNAQFVSCGPDQGAAWTCTPGAGQTVGISLNLSDPTAIDAATLGQTTIVIFVPATDVTAAPSGQLDTTNVIRDLDAKGVDGTPAVGEDPADNSANLTLLAGSGAGSFYKYYRDFDSPTGFVPGGSNTAWSGNGTVSPGQIYQASYEMGNSSAAGTFTAGIACDVFDTTTQRVSTAGAVAASNGGKPAAVSWNPENLVEGTDFVIEYSTVATSTDPDDATRWAALRSTECGGPSGDWSTTAPSDPGTITKVRTRLLHPIEGAFNLEVGVNFAALPGATGTVIANFESWQVDGGAWQHSGYQPATHQNPGTGDRLLLAAGQLALAKDIITPAAGATDQPRVAAGDSVQFRLRPTVQVPTQSIDPSVAQAHGVRVVDVLPAGTSFDTSGAHAPSLPPSSVVYDPATGQTTVTWEIGDLRSDEPPPVISYWADVATTTNGAKVNRAIVTSPDDPGSISALSIPNESGNPRFAARTINVDSLGGIQIDKAVRQQVIEPSDEITYDVTYANLGSSPQGGMDAIDVLPFDGDGNASGNVPGRNPGSSFHGSFAVQNVTVNAGETVRYTDADPAAIYATYDPSSAGAAGYGTLPPGKAWCTAAQIGASAAGCPAAIGDATAIRVTRPTDLGAGDSAVFSYTLKTTGNRSGDVYANTAALRGSGLQLGTLSPTRAARVVANRIGDFVWQDTNGDGIQGAGEPGVPGVDVVLDGTDKHGQAVHVTTTTGSDGKYLFTSSSQAGQDAKVLDLDSGTYHVTFVPSSLPAGASFTLQHSAGSTPANDSDANPATGRSDDLVLPDPTGSGLDGEDLTLDAGIILGTVPPVVPPVTPPTPETPPNLLVPPVPTPPSTVAPGKPKLSLRKTASRGSVRPGATVRYRLTVRNRGNATAQSVRVCDDLPRGLTLVSRGGGQLRGGQLCWTIKSLAAGRSVTRSFSARIDANARPGAIVNRASVNAVGTKAVVAKRKVRVLPARQQTLNESLVTG